MPNQALSSGYRCVIWVASAEIAQNPAFQVSFHARPTLFSVSGNRYCTAKIRCRAAGPPQGRRHLGARQGQIHRRFQPARASLCLDRALQPRPRDHSRHRHIGGQSHARRARGLDRRRSRFGELWPLHLRPAAEEPRWHPAAADQPHRADDRQGTVCRRSRGVCGGPDPGAGARCRRSRGARYRSAAGRHQRRRGGKTRRTAALRSHPQQRGAGLSLRRRRQGRRRFRRRRTCHKTRYRQHPRRCGGDGAAGGAGLLRQGERALHDSGSHPGGLRQSHQSRQEPAEGAEREGSPPMSAARSA